MHVYSSLALLTGCRPIREAPSCLKLGRLPVAQPRLPLDVCLSIQTSPPPGRSPLEHSALNIDFISTSFPPHSDLPIQLQSPQHPSHIHSEATIATLRLTQIASSLTMGGGPEQKAEHLLVILPFPEPTEIFDRMRKNHPQLKITFRMLLYSDTPWKAREAIPKGGVDSCRCRRRSVKSAYQSHWRLTSSTRGQQKSTTMLQYLLHSRRFPRRRKIALTSVRLPCRPLPSSQTTNLRRRSHPCLLRRHKPLPRLPHLHLNLHPHNNLVRHTRPPNLRMGPLHRPRALPPLQQTARLATRPQMGQRLRQSRRSPHHPR